MVLAGTGMAVALAGIVSCSAAGKYVWVDAYRDTSGELKASYAIAPGDLLQIRVFNADHLSTRARVREDGKVSMPLLNDIPAAGLTPIALANDLKVRLANFVKTPSVTVSVEETRPSSVYVTGEVAKPGVYPVDSARGVLEALVNAGGLTVNAREDRIFVLRTGSQTTRIRFTYPALTRLEGRASTFRLRSGDIVVVE